MTRSGQLRAFEKEGPPAHWVEVKMNGYKSNSGGIGSVVEFKAGNYYNKVDCHQQPRAGFYRRPSQARCHSRHLAECGGAELD